MGPHLGDPLPSCGCGRAAARACHTPVSCGPPCTCACRQPPRAALGGARVRACVALAAAHAHARACCRIFSRSSGATAVRELRVPRAQPTGTDALTLREWRWIGEAPRGACALGALATPALRPHTDRRGAAAAAAARVRARELGPPPHGGLSPAVAGGGRAHSPGDAARHERLHNLRPRGLHPFARRPRRRGSWCLLRRAHGGRGGARGARWRRQRLSAGVRAAATDTKRRCARKESPGSDWRRSAHQVADASAPAPRTRGHAARPVLLSL